MRPAVVARTYAKTMFPFAPRLKSLRNRGLLTQGRISPHAPRQQVTLKPWKPFKD